MLRGPVAHGDFPPDEQLEVLTLATSTTSEHDCVASQWSLDDLAAQIVNRHADEAMTRSTIWRVLNAADLKPHRSVYWLNSHDPDFDTKARDICQSTTEWSSMVWHTPAAFRPLSVSLAPLYAPSDPRLLRDL